MPRKKEPETRQPRLPWVEYIPEHEYAVSIGGVCISLERAADGADRWQMISDPYIKDLSRIFEDFGPPVYAVTIQVMAEDMLWRFFSQGYSEMVHKGFPVLFRQQ